MSVTAGEVSRELRRLVLAAALRAVRPRRSLAVCRVRLAAAPARWSGLPPLRLPGRAAGATLPGVLRARLGLRFGRRPPSPTRGRRGAWSRPASSVPCALWWARWPLWRRRTCRSASPSPRSAWAMSAAWGRRYGRRRSASATRRLRWTVTCVPAHRGHKLERGFNQAELLARDLARAAGLPLRRCSCAPATGAARAASPRPREPPTCAAPSRLARDAQRVAAGVKRVLVIDDVFTTGETLNQCSSMLVAAGLEPHAFTFARTVREARL